MLLYETLLMNRHRLELPVKINEQLDQATVIVVDNVARFYFTESSQEEWDIRTDFPNCAPPWPVAFFEFTTPKVLNSEGQIITNPNAGLRWGLLLASERPESTTERFRSFDVEDLARNAAWSAISTLAAREQPEFRQILRDYGPDGLWSKLSDVQRTLFRDQVREFRDSDVLHDVAWVCEGIAFLMAPREKPVAFMHFQFPIRADGSFLIGDDGRVVCTYGPWGNTDDLIDLVEQIQYLPLHVPLLATSFAHCKNVEVQAVDPPEKLSRKQFKRHGVPKVRYHVLEISPMRSVLKRDGGLEQHGSAQKALHICRGHFKDYRERGLFGKVKGMFWWDSHVRGSAQQGVVVKDYEVKAP